LDSVDEIHVRAERRRMKTPIADAFKKWEKTATREEKQSFCDFANSVAKALKGIRKKVE
jgi:hypothetical protein